MERLLVLRLESSGCAAEAVYNGVPLARVGPGQTLAWLPVHEYTLAGANELQLLIEPPPPQAPGVPAPEPRLADGKAWATLRLLLPRIGATASPASARTLAQLDWAPTADDTYEVPLALHSRVEVPAGFPRWRWLDAPAIPDGPALRREAAAYLLEIALGLARGKPDPLILASRLRLEDLAQAYQHNLNEVVGRLRDHILAQHALAPLTPPLPAADQLVLRPVAEGRLLECLASDGSPVLRSPRPDGGCIGWPVRLAVVEGRFYVLR